MSRGVYLHWIKWKLFICSLVPVVSTSTRYWGICLYRPDHSVAYSIPGIISRWWRLSKQHPSLLLVSTKKEESQHKAPITFISGEANEAQDEQDMDKQNSYYRTCLPSHRKDRSPQSPHLAACPYGEEWLFFTGCLHPRKREEGARSLIP